MECKNCKNDSFKEIYSVYLGDSTNNIIKRVSNIECNKCKFHYCTIQEGKFQAISEPKIQE
jgi:Zn finger protein HypA/HybF involved in hydrogenase expression